MNEAHIPRAKGDLYRIARRIGARVRKARVAARMTQRQLAGQRYTPAYISALERGLAKPSLASLFHIADRLAMQPAELLLDLPEFPQGGTLAVAKRVRLADERIYIELIGGVEIGVPLQRFPVLLEAPWAALRHWKISSDGSTVLWPELGQSISLGSLLRHKDAPSAREEIKPLTRLAHTPANTAGGE